eukprot:g12799.t1
MPGSNYEWYWTLDDVRFPSFEEQHRAQLLQQNVPSIIIGRWPSGLLRFLARRELWTQLLVAPQASAFQVISILGCRRRRCMLPPVLTVSEAAAKKFADELGPVIRFVRKGLASDPVQVPLPSSAAARAQLYVNRSNEGTTEPAKKRVLHKSGCLQAVLQNPLLQEPKPGYTLEASPTASSMLLSTKLKNLVLCPQNMWPVVQLCNALILEADFRC